MIKKDFPSPEILGVYATIKKHLERFLLQEFIFIYFLFCNDLPFLMDLIEVRLFEKIRAIL